MICSNRHGLGEETACVQVSFSCGVHRRCALGFGEDTIPRARSVGGVRQVTCSDLPYTRGASRSGYTPTVLYVLARSVNTT